MPSSHSFKSVLQTLRQVFYIIGYALCRVFLKPRDGLVLFLSDSAATPVGNAKAVIEELSVRGYEVQTVTRPGLRVRRTLREHFELCILMARARVIMVDDFFPMIYQIRLSTGTQLLQLWHASGAFKTMGFSRSGKPGGPIKGSKTHKNYSAAICSSQSVRTNYAQAFGISLDKVHATGIPRTDPFFNQNLVLATTEKVRAELQIPQGKKLLLFAPTFRGNGQLSAHYDHSLIDWQDLADRFADEYVLGIRMHPFVKVPPPALTADTRFLDLSTYPDPNALLMATDLLITDYSSIIFDYALLERPVIFFCPDLEQYTASRDFYYPFERYTFGPVAHTYSELADAISDAALSPANLAQFREFFVGACDGRSTKRVVDELIAPHLGQVEDKAYSATGKTKSVSAKERVKVAAAIAIRTALAVLYAPMKLLPTQNKVTLISRQADTPSIDFDLLIAKLLAAPQAPKVVVLTHEFHSSLTKKLAYIPHILKQMAHIATSRTVVVDTYCIPVSALTHKKSLRIIQTWHAMGAIKKFGYSILDRGEGSSGGIARAMHMHRNYDVVLASSPAAAPFFAEAFNVPTDRVVVAPLPRVDLLTNTQYLALTRANLIERFPELAGGKNILFAPTFHKGQTFDAAALETYFAQRGFTFIAKPHPVSLGAGKPNRYREVSAFDLLAVADYVVTDYSSIMVEAAVADIPIFVLAPDLAQYRQKRSFYMDFEAEAPGPIAASFEELRDNIEGFSGELTPVREFAQRWVNSPQEESCTEQIVRLVLTAPHECTVA